MISRLSAASGHPTPAEAIGCRTEVQREADMDAGISIISRTNETWEARNRKQPMFFYIQGALVNCPIGPANNPDQ